MLKLPMQSLPLQKSLGASFLSLSIPALLLSLASVSASAYDNRQEVYSGWSWSANVDHLSIDHEAANRPDTLIGDTATTIGFAAERYSSDSEWTFGLGMNVLLYNDNNEFYQYVSDHWGNGYSYEQSDAGGLMLYAEAGPRYQFGASGMNFFTPRLGVSGIVASSRSISDCSDCYSEDINLKGGVYGVLGVGHNFGSFDLSLEFEQYFSGDLNNSLRLKIATSF